MLNKIYLLIIILFFFCNISLAKDNIFIVSIVEDQIITNHDIYKEASYLKILNPKITELNEEQIQVIAKDSLINEIIKKNEIKKVLDMNKENTFINDYIKDFYTKLDFNSEVDFKNFLISSSSYTFEEIRDKIKIEMMWNELIYLKYGNQVNINKENLLKKIDGLTNEVRSEYKLSEIVFKKDKEISFEDQIKKIKSSIIEIGFDNTANIHSISESSKLGGNIGWINENNLSKVIYTKIKNLNKDEVSDVIQIGNNFLILKVNEIRKKDISIDKEEELKKMVKFETNKQLNQFSKIFFDKTKINYSINEK